MTPGKGKLFDGARKLPEPSTKPTSVARLGAVAPVVPTEALELPPLPPLSAKPRPEPAVMLRLVAPVAVIAAM